MKLLEQTLVHPTQPTAVVMRVHQTPDGGFLVTESRVGTTTVVATLGAFDAAAPAEARARARIDELLGQRYRQAAAAA